jgi:hypothetical protein
VRLLRGLARIDPIYNSFHTHLNSPFTYCLVTFWFEERLYISKLCEPSTLMTLNDHPKFT